MLETCLCLFKLLRSNVNKQLSNYTRLYDLFFTSCKNKLSFTLFHNLFSTFKPLLVNSPFMSTTEKTLLRFLDLEDNWDGYSAPRFTQQHIQYAIQILGVITQYAENNNIELSSIDPFVAPCSNGDILFDWTGKNYPIRQLEIHIPFSLHSLEYLKVDNPSLSKEVKEELVDINTEEMEEGIIDEDNITIESLLDWLLEMY